MLTTAQRERIICHLQHGWKLPDSLVHELWEAYKELEETQISSVESDDGVNGMRQTPMRRSVESETRSLN